MIPTVISTPVAAGLGDRIILDQHCNSMSVVELALRDLQSGTTHPFSETRSVEIALAPREVLGSRWTIVRAAQTSWGVAALAIAGADAVLIRSDTTTTLTYASATLAGLAATRHELEDTINALVAMQSVDTCRLRIWHAANGATPARFTDRRLAALHWDRTAHNYPPATRTRLDRVMTHAAEPDQTGRLILWHGEAGTGKTSAVRSLMSAWQPWCAAHYIADPDQFFHRADYIAEVLAHPTPTGGANLESSGHGSARWKVIVAEDCDEYLRSNARTRDGASMGRLLNLTDGLLGQGTDTVVLLTTNEPLGRLHPAITRAGRCLDITEFHRFSPEAATARLGSPVSSDMTLAEIYQHLSGASPTIAIADLVTGQYL